MKIKTYLAILVFSVICFGNVDSMKPTTNELVVFRGNNYSFTVETTMSFSTYSVEIDSTLIAFIKKTNNTHIIVDYIIPTVINVQMYTFTIRTFDTAYFELENCTFIFVIGNLTDEELFDLLFKNNDLEIRNDNLEDENAGILNNSTNGTNPWANISHTSTWEKHGSSITTVSLATCSVFSIMGTNQLMISRRKNRLLEKERKKKEKHEKNHRKSVLSKQASSFNMNKDYDKLIDGELMQVPLLNVFEIEAVKNYNDHYDAAYFLVPDDKMLIKMKKERKDVSSIDIIKHIFGIGSKDEEKIKYRDLWLTMSAITKYLEREGFINRDDEFMPVGCSVKKLRIFQGKMYVKMKMQESKILEKEEPVDETTKSAESASAGIEGIRMANRRQKKFDKVKQVDPVEEEKEFRNKG